MTEEKKCPNCQRSWGAGAVCRWCGQVEGLPTGMTTSSAGKRFVAYLLELVLAVVTLGVGYAIWALIVFKDGQTPAKQVMKMRAVSVATADHATWGQTFLRELMKLVISLLLGWLIFPYFWFLWDSSRQELWDKAAGTIVVNDPEQKLA